MAEPGEKRGTRGVRRRPGGGAAATWTTPPPLGPGPLLVRAGRGADAARGRAGLAMVARTDDIAFVLLDEEPGEVLPVGRGPELPGLLKSLDKLAVRPH